MPALFALGLHDTLAKVKANMQRGEHLFAYLDDIYVVCRPDRAKAVFELIERTLSAHTGVHCNMGKTRVWNRGGVEPPGVRELGPEVWVGGAERPAEQRGVKVLGTPLGTAEYATALGKKRYEKQNKLLQYLPKLLDL